MLRIHKREAGSLARCEQQPLGPNTRNEKGGQRATAGQPEAQRNC